MGTATSFPTSTKPITNSQQTPRASTMPVAIDNIPVDKTNRHFKSLQELDQWSPKGTSSTLPFRPRDSGLTTSSKGKLLVCHDYKGGYTEKPLERSYTFNFWSLCEIFIYFSHHRVTIPPSGWVTAAHRQGVKILGTLIFEGGAEADCLRLVVGKLPTSKTGQVGTSAPPPTLPVSPHYAKVLALLAKERGFDGYLLNFECPLIGSVEQTRALAAWITILQTELVKTVGPHAETVWYDSVIFDGRLAWQDRLNSLNLPFFLASTKFFSNYTWHPDNPSTTASYFLSLEPETIGSYPSSQKPTQISAKTLQSVYMGVDVWGRGSHGGGGFGSFKAISHIAPDSLGLSVALFAPAWSWETEQDKPGFSWDSWWTYERKLWLGPLAGETVDIPNPPPRQGEPIDCDHGEGYTALNSFFDRLPPPDPADAPLFVTFCPGRGSSWFVQGQQVWTSPTGEWTDIDKQTAVGDLVWPKPALLWLETEVIGPAGGNGQEPLPPPEPSPPVPNASSAFCTTDAWNGGSSIKISVDLPTVPRDLLSVLSIPIQSITLGVGRQYEAAIVYKPAQPGILLKVGVAALRELGSAFEEHGTPVTLQNGWRKAVLRFAVGRSQASSVNVAVEKVVTSLDVVFSATIALQTPMPSALSFLLGQITISPVVPDPYAEAVPVIIWADYTPLPTTGSALHGLLSWSTSVTLPRVTHDATSSPLADRESPQPAWNPQPTIPWFPSFAYVNIYAQRHSSAFETATSLDVKNAIWVGTSNALGWELKAGLGQFGEDDQAEVISILRTFGLELGTGRRTTRKQTGVTFYVQGVSDRGEVLDWDKCAWVDVTLELEVEA